MSGPLVHACLSCGQRLEPTSKYCWSCGSSKLKTGGILLAGDAREVFDAPRYHSRKRKLASFLAGGPFGFFAFGMDIPRKSGPESQIVVTNNATYFAGKTYPLNRISDVKRGHYSNSI